MTVSDTNGGYFQVVASIDEIDGYTAQTLAP